jgi:hypothetical protein
MLYEFDTERVPAIYPIISSIYSAYRLISDGFVAATTTVEWSEYDTGGNDHRDA